MNTMQLASTYGAVSFDEPQVLSHVARAQRAERAATFKTYLLRQAISLPVRTVVSWCVVRGADLLIAHVGKRSTQLKRVADFLDDQLPSFQENIESRHRVPSENFIADFERLHQSNIQLVILCTENVDRLRALNPQSRVARAFEAMRLQVTRIDSAALVYLEWGRAARDTRFAQHALSKLTRQIDKSLQDYDSESLDFDPELLARAKNAVSRLEQN